MPGLGESRSLESRRELGGSDMEISDTMTVVPVRNEVFTTQELLAPCGFLAGYSGLTREAYALDFRQYVA
jgi:hypothetical protein